MQSVYRTVGNSTRARKPSGSKAKLTSPPCGRRTSCSSRVPKPGLGRRRHRRAAGFAPGEGRAALRRGVEAHGDPAAGRRRARRTSPRWWPSRAAAGPCRSPCRRAGSPRPSPGRDRRAPGRRASAPWPITSASGTGRPPAAVTRSWESAMACSRAMISSRKPSTLSWPRAVWLTMAIRMAMPFFARCASSPISRARRSSAALRSVMSSEVPTTSRGVAVGVVWRRRPCARIQRVSPAGVTTRCSSE